MIKNSLLLIFIFAFAILITGCNFSLAADITPPPGAQAPAVESQAQTESAPNQLFPLVAPDPQAGAATYVEKCAPCHGPSGLGNGERAADLPNPVAAIGTSDLARNATLAQWYNVVTQGNLERFMPPFPSLNDRQRWDVTAYAFTLSETPDVLETGQALYTANCAGCHGESGQGDGPAAAGATLPDFTDQAYMANQSASGFFQVISDGAEGMPAFAGQLSEEQRWALAAYLRSYSFARTGDLAQATVQPDQVTAAGETQATPEIAASDLITPTLKVGSIAGLVSNASGGELPVGAEVMLHGFDDQQMALTSTVTIAANGTYLFDNIEMPHGRIFFTTLQHQDVTYGSDMSTLDPTAENPKLDLPITIYDTTQDLDGLKIDRMHLFFEQLDEQTMRVAELLVMSNTGTKTIVPPGDGEPSVKFRLPEGFADLQFQDGELGGRYIQTDGGFGDSAVIYPGQGDYQVLMAYTLPYQRKLDLSLPVDLPTDAVVILAPAESFNVKGENLQDAGTRDVEGVPFQMYNLANLNAGDQLELSVSQRSALLGNSTVNGVVFGLVALGLALILGGVWMYWRNRQAAEDEDALDQEANQVAPGASAQTSEEIMDAILTLDDLHLSGQISEETYLERRAELKARLKNIIEK